MSKINVNNIEANDASTDITVTTGGSQSLLVDTNGKLTVAGNLSVNGNNYPSAGPLSNRNLIINGAMQVAQRGTSFTGQTGSGYFIDRFKIVQADDAVWTYSQETDAPSGFANSFKALVTTVDATNGASDYQFIRYSLEGQDLQQLKKGTSDAESVTLSFWVKCSNAGTFISELNDADNNRTISRSYTINAANTWEYKTVTFDGDTTGSLDNDNAESLRVHWWYAAGSDYTSGTLATSWQSRTNVNRAVGSSVNIPTISGGYFQITGVQLEVGDTATDFEHRSYGDELAKCQRYYQEVDRGSGITWSTSSAYISIPYITTMRAVPSFGTTGPLALNDARTNVSQTTAHVVAYNANTSGAFTQMNNFSPSLVQYSAALMRGNTGNFVTLDAEL